MASDLLRGDLSQHEYATLAEVRRLLRRYQAFSERAAQADGLEARQYQLLLMVRGLAPTGRASVSDVADWLQVRHHSAVGLVDRMAERGLVERQADPQDGRRVLITLTQTGRAALKGLALQHRDELRTFAPSLIEVLQRVVSTHQAVARSER